MTSRISGVIVNAQQVHRLPNTSSLVFPLVEADELLMNMPSLMLGTGSACTSGAPDPSHVLQAIGLSREMASSTVRASFGYHQKLIDVVEASSILVDMWFMIVTREELSR